MSASEYLPTEDSRQENKRITALASEAYQRAACDLKLSHGAVRLFVLLTERSWWFNWGGDSKGGIARSIDKLTSDLGANQRFVMRWLRQLERGEYIWTDKIPQRSGYDASKYFISCLAPKVTQRELSLVGSSANGRVGSSANGPVGSSANGPVGSNGHSPVGTSAHLKEVKEAMEVKGGATPPVRQGSEDLTDDDPTGFKKWRTRLENLFPKEQKEKLALLRADLKKLSSDSDNFKRGELRPELKEFVDYARAQLPRLKKSKKPEDRKRAKDYRQKIQNLETDPSSYYRGALLPGPAANKANITRKIAAIEEVLR